ncbi:hypothetical protein PFISCL1PPCAC_717, partial [Pristionchus fissidentatus]
LRDARKFDFSQRQNLSDVALNINGKAIHVNKQYLSLCSPYFSALLNGHFAESDKNTIELKNVSYMVCLNCDDVIFAGVHGAAVDNVEALLKLGDRYDFDFVVKAAEDFLVSTEDLFSYGRLLLLSDLYRLPQLQTRCLAYYSQPRRLKDLK